MFSDILQAEGVPNPIRSVPNRIGLGTPGVNTFGSDRFGDPNPIGVHRSDPVVMPGARKLGYHLEPKIDALLSSKCKLYVTLQSNMAIFLLGIWSIIHGA